MIPLFEEYPDLTNNIPRAELGKFPTPIKPMRLIGGDIGVKKLFIKCDDVSGEEYGGNKVRKLEFLLGEAVRNGVDEVITFGAAGSNHALATALYAGKLDLEATLMLIPQPNARYVRRNLLMDYAAGAGLEYFPGQMTASIAARLKVLHNRFMKKTATRVIPFGGTTEAGTAGFVNAAFELRGQVEKRKMPEPDYIYVPLGSMGTAVGLMLGLKAANLKTRVVAVRVVPFEIANHRKMKSLFDRTSRFLNRADPSFPRYELTEDEIILHDGFFGGRYGLFTRESAEAVAYADKREGIKLEGTYTGKALAALLDDGRKQLLKDRVVLFWNTHNSRDFPESVDSVDYRALPHSLRSYFENSVQPLDRKK